MSESKRPQLTSMEGMIWNANHVLQTALNPGLRGIPKGYFMSCAGICILSTVQAGFIFSGSVGTGIFLKRDMDGVWSNPVACAIGGVGFGLLIGATVKDVIIFMADEASVQTFFTTGIKLGAQSDLTIGIGREFDFELGASLSGMSSTLAISYTKGAFIGISMEGAVVSPRKGANEAFYGPGNGNPADIIEGKVAFPTDKVTMFDEVKVKLNKLAKGMCELPDDKETKKAEQAAVVANSVAESIKQSEDDIVHVDAEAEAAKEK